MIEVNFEGAVQPIQKPRRVLLTWPTTQTIGLHGNVDAQAETLYECIRLIATDHNVSEISAATGLNETFVSALADRLWP